MASRNIFRRGGSPLGSVQLFDPFTTMVANINKQLAFLQQQKALAALAAGDPDGFLTLAEGIIKTVSGDEKKVWEDLIKKANNKIEETAWAAEVNSGRATLEEFKQHLQQKLSDAPEGTQEAYDVITAIDGVNKSIAARDTAKADQAALSKYIDNNNHTEYANYLIKKLQGTTDPAAFNTLRNQIEELKARSAAEEQVSRIRSRGDAMSAYLDGKTSAAATIQKLQELALDPKISATEVSALQTLVTQIHDREDAAARRAASGSASTSYGVNPQEFLANLQTYKDTRAQVDQILADGGDPSKPIGSDRSSPLDKLRAAASILTDQYQVAAETAASQGKIDTSDKYATDAQSIQTHLGKVPGQIDTNTINAAVGSTITQFNANIKDMTTAEARTSSRVNRIAALSGIAPYLKTPENQQKVSAEINVLSSDARGDANKLAQTDNLGDKDRKDLHDLYNSYSQLAAQNGAQPVRFEDFMQAAMDAASKGKDATDIARMFAQKTGLKLDPQLSLPMGNFGEMNKFTGQTDASVQASDIVKQVSDIASKSDLIKNQESAMELNRKLLQTPGGVPFGPPGSPEYQILGLTAQDILEMRRGAGLIAGYDFTPQQPTGAGPAQPMPNTSGTGKSNSLRPEEDLTSYENSQDELRQELKLQRDAARQAQEQNQPSIEDTMLAMTPPPIDLSMFSMMDAGIQPPQQDPYAGLPQNWADAYNYLDSGQNIDVPGFQIPDLPTTNPFQVDLPSVDSGNSFSGSDPGGPAPLPDLPGIPSPGVTTGNSYQ